MGKKITTEQIIQINEEYLSDPIKSHVAKKLGISPATVTKYLIEGYISQKDIKTGKKSYHLPCIETIKLGNDWGSLCMLSEQEKKELEELQKTIFI